MEAELEALHARSFGWALACCDRDHDQASEVLQMAYVKVLEGTARFGGRSSFKMFLFGVIRKTAIEQRRRRWLDAGRLSRWAAARTPDADVADPEHAASAGESTRELRAALARLSRRQRELLHLVFYQDLTVEEAAGVLAISVGSARRHYDRGKARLRLLLASEARA